MGVPLILLIKQESELCVEALEQKSFFKNTQALLY